MKTKRSYDWIINKSNIPYLKIDLKVPVTEILDEILNIKNNTVEQSGNAKWKGAVIHGISASKPRPFKFYGYTHEDEVPYKWTNISSKMPITVNWIKKTFKYEKLYRVKINLLEPNGEIGPHIDSKKIF